MIAVTGTYHNGHVVLDEPLSAEENVRVIVTFPDASANSSESRLRLSDFSFSASRKMLSDYKGSFSESLIEERRSES